MKSLRDQVLNLSLADLSDLLDALHLRIMGQYKLDVESQNYERGVELRHSLQSIKEASARLKSASQIKLFKPDQIDISILDLDFLREQMIKILEDVNTTIEEADHEQTTTFDLEQRKFQVKRQLDIIDRLQKREIILCSICEKPITETGTAYKGRPAHIECFHRKFQKGFR